MVDATILKRWMLENNGNILYDPMHPNIFSGYVTFTPERAASALENNINNRKLNTTTQLPILMDSMKNGEWDDNIETIAFTDGNTLSNGQHRLESSVRAGVSFRNLVTYGVSDRAKHYTDRRGSRKLTDDFHMDDLKNKVHLASITRILYKRRVCGTEPKALVNRNSTISAVSDATLYDFFYSNRAEIEEKERLTANVYTSVRTLGIPQSIVNVLALEFDAVNSEDAKYFWEKLSSGYTTKENDPIIALRKRLETNRIAKTNKMPSTVMTALIIKTWNFYMRGQTTDCLKFTSGGSHPEDFPKIYNPYFEAEE